MFSFQDITLLRTARDLVASDVSPRKVRRALESLRKQLPAGRPLSAVQLDALGGQVLVRDGGRTWEADTGQMHLGLDEGTDPTPRVPVRTTALPGPSWNTPAPSLTADDWYDRALTFEPDNPDGAKRAYAQALALEPDHAESHLNLGRLLHEEGAVSEAEQHYRAAVASCPANGRGFYNLGVALEDQGRTKAAAQAYERALDVDPDLAVAHFNLSRLCETLGRPEDALRHLAAYKRILDRGGAYPDLTP